MRKENESRSRGWLAGVVVLSLGWLLLYAARTALSSELKAIGDFWGLSQTYLGFLSSAFFISYTILQIPSGFLADRFGSRKLIILGFAVQAAGLVLGSLSKTPTQFLLARVLTGAGQATYFACQQAIISFTLPANRRAAGTAATIAGAGLGGAVGFVIGKALSSSSLGWKTPFLVLGGLSAAYILAVLAAVPEPEVRKAAQIAAGSGTEAASPGSPAGAIRPTRPGQANPGWGYLACLALAHFLTMYGFYLMLTWLPYYLETIRGMKSSLSAVIPIVMPLIMAPATVIWGMATDRKGNRDFVLWVCMPIAAISTAAIPAMRTPFLLAMALAVYGATGKLVMDPTLVAVINDASAPEQRNATLAIFNIAGALAMLLAPSVTGLIAEVTGSFDVSFYAAGLFNLAALGAFVQAVRMLGKARRKTSAVR